MKILAALDGSDAAFNAFRTACRIAVRSGATVAAFYVNKGEAYTPEETGSISLSEKIADELETLGQKVISSAYDIGRMTSASVEGFLSRGIPAAEILNYVYDHGIVKLIAAGHSSKGRGAQEFAGSTTRAILAYAKVPVLVASADTQIDRILLAVDSPHSARKSAAFAAMLAKSLQADVSIITVVPDAEDIITEYRHVAEVPGIWRYIEESQQSFNTMAERAVAAAREQLASHGLNFSTTIRRGRPAEVIIAETQPGSVLIVGLKTAPPGNKIGPVALKLLNTPAITSIFV